MRTAVVVVVVAEVDARTDSRSAVVAAAVVVAVAAAVVDGREISWKRRKMGRFAPKPWTRRPSSRWRNE